MEDACSLKGEKPIANGKPSKPGGGAGEMHIPAMPWFSSKRRGSFVRSDAEVFMQTSGRKVYMYCNTDDHFDHFCFAHDGGESSEIRVSAVRFF